MDDITAAERLAGDADLDPVVARPHLRRAWELLHAAAATEDDLLSWAGHAGGERVDAAERERFDAVLRWVLGDGGSEDATPTHAAVFAHAAVLRGLTEHAPGPTASFALFGVTLLVGTLLLMVVAAIVSVMRGPTGPWRGDWFDNQDFEGEPTAIQDARKIEFNWGKSTPQVPGLGHDRWSVIFRTCLEIEEETEVRFRVTSDDGTKLYIDRELVVDNWGAHAARTRTGKKTLTPGKHYLRVDYFEASATAEINVLAAFGEDDKHATIPVEMLSQPDIDAEDPCS